MNLLEKRQVPLAFSSKSISRDQLGKILECCRWVNSPDKLQCIEFTVIEDADLKEIFCREFKLSFCPIILSIASNMNLAGKKFGNLAEKIVSLEIGGMVENIINCATEQNLSVNWILVDSEKVRELLKVPEEYDASNLLLIGYLDKDKRFQPCKYLITDIVYLNEFKKKIKMFYDKFEWQGLRNYGKTLKKRVLKGRGLKN